MKVIIWFHRDLRTHDHEILNWVLSQKHQAIGVAFSPPQNSSRTKLRFWQETTEDLQNNLLSLNIPLLLFSESPREVLPRLIKDYEIEEVFTHKRMNARDLKEIDELRTLLSVPLSLKGDLTLFSFEDGKSLGMRDLRPFTRFKNFITENWKIPSPLPPMTKINKNPALKNHWPVGGESYGCHRLKDYLWETKAALPYHQTRNGLLNRDDSSKLSPWLSWGALSPRLIYAEIKEIEKTTGAQEGLSALIYELIWRDYFKFLSFVQGNSFFDRQGIKENKLEFFDNPELFINFCHGKTAERFVNANMKELLQTGWMSNRGRQNVASYLAKTLKLDWTLGARWFELQLIDEDPENNYGNWQYLAGVGTDPRDRVFDVRRQSLMYDPDGIYQNLWT